MQGNFLPCIDISPVLWHQPGTMLRITDTIFIDESELEEHFIHASGPGGQNVNKVASAVQLRFAAAFSAALPEPVRFRLMQAAGSKLTKDGFLIITAQDFRDQIRNRQAARDRLVSMIRAAAEPEKKRRKTRPPKSVERKRLDTKKRRGKIKQDRANIHIYQ